MRMKKIFPTILLMILSSGCGFDYPLIDGYKIKFYRIAKYKDIDVIKVVGHKFLPNKNPEVTFLVKLTSAGHAERFTCAFPFGTEPVKMLKYDEETVGVKDNTNLCILSDQRRSFDEWKRTGVVKLLSFEEFLELERKGMLDDDTSTVSFGGYSLKLYRTINPEHLNVIKTVSSKFLPDKNPEVTFLVKLTAEGHAQSFTCSFPLGVDKKKILETQAVTVIEAKNDTNFCIIDDTPQT
jgi:hypothetical protein